MIDSDSYYHKVKVVSLRQFQVLLRTVSLIIFPGLQQIYLSLSYPGYTEEQLIQQYQFALEHEVLPVRSISWLPLRSLSFAYSFLLHATDHWLSVPNSFTRISFLYLKSTNWRRYSSNGSFWKGHSRINHVSLTG